MSDLDPPEVAAASRDPRKRIGRYVLLAELGKGGMGIVYRAWDTSLRRQVALKMILNPALVGDEGLARFKAEAQAVGRLQHPGIVAVYEIGEHQGRPFIAMELVQGESLEAQLRRAPVDARRAAALGREIALALAHAHEHGIVHRDVKPENVIVDPEGRMRLMDFGLAKDATRAEQLTVTGVALGTPAYMAPEQGGDKALQGPRSDVYSLGALIYRAVAGRPPFEGPNIAAVMKKVFFEAPKALREAVPSVPAALDAVVAKCLEKTPDKRYATALALAEDLESFLATGRVAAARTVSSRVGRARSSARVAAAKIDVAKAPRSPLPLVTLGVVGIALGAIVFVRARASPPQAAVGLEVSSPLGTSAERPAVSAGEIAVAGRLGDPKTGPVHVVADGKELLQIPVGSDGLFTSRVALPSTTKALELVAGSSRSTVYVDVDLDPPVLELEAPDETKAGEHVELVALVKSRHPGSTVHFVVLAGGEPQTSDVPLVNRAARFAFDVKEGTDKVDVRVETKDELARATSAERTIRLAQPTADRKPSPAPPPQSTPPPSLAPPPPPPPPPTPSSATERPAPRLVLEPVAGPTNAATFEVKGRVEPSLDAKGDVTIDEGEARPFDVAKGEVKVEVPLATERRHSVKVRVHAPGAELAAELTIDVDRKKPELKVETPVKSEAGDPVVLVVIASTKPLRSLKANARELVQVAPAAGPFRYELELPASGDPKLEVVAADMAGNETKLAPKSFPRPARAEPWQKGVALPAFVRRGKEQNVYLYSPLRAREKKLEIELVHVPPPSDKKDETGFFVGRTAVTWKQFRAYCALAKVKEPPAPRSDGNVADLEGSPPGQYKATDERPVTMITYADAQGFCDFLGLRTPTSKEWGRTAGNDDRSPYPWGKCAPRAELCWGKEDCEDGLAPPTVGGRPEGASWCGALDLVGCVSEYCSDALGAHHGIRGTSFVYPRAKANSWAGTFWAEPDWRVGFRVALDAPKAKTGK